MADFLLDSSDPLTLHCEKQACIEIWLGSFRGFLLPLRLKIDAQEVKCDPGVNVAVDVTPVLHAHIVENFGQ